MIRTVRLVDAKWRKTYEIKFDEDGVLDTVQRLDDGEFLASTHHVCRKIARNAQRIRTGLVPIGFERART